jgi:hypothetical protein
MRIPARHLLDYDSVALAVLMIAISVLELLVLGIWNQRCWIPIATLREMIRSAYKNSNAVPLLWFGYIRAANYFGITAS